MICPHEIKIGLHIERV